MQNRKPDLEKKSSLNLSQKDCKAAADAVTTSWLKEGPQSPRTQEAIAKFIFEHRGSYLSWLSFQPTRAATPKSAPAFRKK